MAENHLFRNLDALERPLGRGDLWFSAVYNRGVYRAVSTTGGLLAGERGTSPVLENLFTGELFFLRRLPLRWSAIDAPGKRGPVRGRFLHGPASGAILWPLDVVRLDRARRRACTFTLGLRPERPGGPPRAPEGAYAGLFPLPCPALWRDGTQWVPEFRPLSWENRAVRKIAVRIVEAVAALNRDGFLYQDFRLSRLLYDSRAGFRLDYSELAVSAPEPGVPSEPSFLPEAGGSPEAGTVRALPAGEYPLEFGDPAVHRGLAPDVHSQNYSLCALLFYLFFGRHPYDGRLALSGAEDNNLIRYLKLRRCQQFPVFLFEPLEPGEKHSLPPGRESRFLLARWNRTPRLLRTYFSRTLCRANALRTPEAAGDWTNPSPADWLACFRRLGWTDAGAVSGYSAPSEPVPAPAAADGAASDSSAPEVSHNEPEDIPGAPENPPAVSGGDAAASPESEIDSSPPEIVSASPEYIPGAPEYMSPSPESVLAVLERDAMGYASLLSEPPPAVPLETAVEELLASPDAAPFRDAERLHAALSSRGVSREDADALAALSRSLLDADPLAGETLRNRFLCNVLRDTNLSYRCAVRLADRLRPPDASSWRPNLRESGIRPAEKGLTESESNAIRQFRDVTAREKGRTRRLPEPLTAQVRAIADAGHPEAAYSLGRALVKRRFPLDWRRGAAYLRFAARSGSFAAVYALADACAKSGASHWGEALSCWTLPGGAALNETQQAPLTALLNRTRRSRAILRWTFRALVVVLLLFLSLLFLPERSRPAVDIPACLCAIGVYAAAAALQRRNPCGGGRLLCPVLLLLTFLGALLIR